MTRLCALALLILAAAAQPARAGDAGPVCRYRTVVDEMQRQVRLHDHDAAVVPQLVQQIPTPAANIVRCDICALDAIYDTPRFGDQPARRCVRHDFEIRIAPRGFIVRQVA